MCFRYSGPRGGEEAGGEGARDNAFCGASFSAEEALAAIRAECRLPVPTGTLRYRFYVYRGVTGDRACIEREGVRALGERDPEEPDAFYAEFYRKDWLPEGVTARRGAL